MKINSNVGRTRERLAIMIEERLADAGWIVRCNAEDLRPATGSHRTNKRLDIMPWDGYIDLKRESGWIRMSICSWITMSSLIREKDWQITLHMGYFEIG